VNRNNTYPAPGTALDVAGGLQSFETGDCASPPGLVATLDPTTPTDPDFIARATINSPQFLFDNLVQIAFNNALSTSGVAAPACVKQGPQASIGQIPELTDYTPSIGTRRSRLVPEAGQPTCYQVLGILVRTQNSAQLQPIPVLGSAE
jgi:hypothetical protein